MLHRVFILILLMSAGIGAAWLADNPGEFTVRWIGYEIRTSLFFLVLAIVLLASLVWLLIGSIIALTRLPGDMQRTYRYKKQEKGLEALTEAFIALADQNPDRARKQIREAEMLLANPTLPRLLQLQLTRQEGSDAALRDQFVQLQNNDQTRPLALKGLIEEARDSDRMDEALRLAEELYRAEPRRRIAVLTAADLFSYHHRWVEALHALDAGTKRLLFNKDEAAHTGAVILTSQAMDAEKHGDLNGAAALAKKAAKRDSGMTAAALLLARLQIAEGRAGAAAKTLVQAWQAAPHPNIWAAYHDLIRDVEPEKRMEKVHQLIRHNPDHPESRVALAKAAIAANQYDLARTQLLSALDQRETVQVCHLLAEVEAAQGRDPQKIEQWRDRAKGAHQDDFWQCTNCQSERTRWEAHCGHCRHFDTVRWKARPYLSVTEV